MGDLCVNTLINQNSAVFRALQQSAADSLHGRRRWRHLAVDGDATLLLGVYDRRKRAQGEQEEARNRSTRRCHGRARADERRSER